MNRKVENVMKERRSGSRETLGDDQLFHHFLHPWLLQPVLPPVKGTRTTTDILFLTQCILHQANNKHHIVLLLLPQSQHNLSLLLPQSNKVLSQPPTLSRSSLSSINVKENQINTWLLWNMLLTNETSLLLRTPSSGSLLKSNVQVIIRFSKN